MTGFEEAKNTDFGGACLCVSPTGWYYLHLHQGEAYDLEPSSGVMEWMDQQGIAAHMVTSAFYCLEMNQDQQFAAKIRWG